MTMEDIQLSEHLKLSELRCHCSYGKGNCGGAVVIPSDEFIVEFEMTHKQFGRIKINRGYSCKTHNKKVGGAPKSFHTMYDKRYEKYGAIDGVPIDYIKSHPDDWCETMYVWLCENSNWGGIIAHKSRGFIHMDMRPKRFNDWIEEG